MDLYSEIVLDHYRNPKNYGALNDPTCTAEEFNPLCGDKIRFDLMVGKGNIVEKAAFSGEGCAISQAAASMLTELLMGKTLEEITKMENGEIYESLGVPISPGRVKCALLGLCAAKKAARLGMSGKQRTRKVPKNS